MTRSTPRTAAVPLGWRSTLVLALASLGGLVAFCWPLLVRVDARQAQHVLDAPLVFILLLPVLLVVVLAQVAEGGIDARALAMLGVLSAVNAALRPIGAGIAGIELVFFLLVLAGRVFGPGFGFVLGCTSLFASALLTAGVGPWLPFQMLCAAWIGMGAGLLPRQLSGRGELLLLAAYGIFVAYAFGMLMNLWYWPFVAGIAAPGVDANVAFIPGDPLVENLRRFGLYTLFTSTATWDTGRAVTNALAILLLGRPLLATLRRAARRAAFVERRTRRVRDLDSPDDDLSAPPRPARTRRTPVTASRRA